MRPGRLPFDQLLRLSASHLTPAAAEVTCLTGVQTSFAQASETTLRKLCGLRLCESTVERTTESTGERLRALLAAGETFAKPAAGKSAAWEWERDARGHTCAYVGVDATGVRQQGERGAKAAWPTWAWSTIPAGPRERSSGVRTHSRIRFDI